MSWDHPGFEWLPQAVMTSTDTSRMNRDSRKWTEASLGQLDTSTMRKLDTKKCMTSNWWQPKKDLSWTYNYLKNSKKQNKMKRTFTFRWLNPSEYIYLSIRAENRKISKSSSTDMLFPVLPIWNFPWQYLLHLSHLTPIERVEPISGLLSRLVTL